jgi:hypothetical protein
MTRAVPDLPQREIARIEQQLTAILLHKNAGVQELRNLHVVSDALRMPSIGPRLLFAQRRARSVKKT